MRILFVIPTLLMTAILAAGAPAFAHGGHGEGSTPLEGKWVIRNRSERSVDMDLLWTDGTNWRRWYPITALEGLAKGDLGGYDWKSVAFRFGGDAGSFAFEGSVRGGRGRGWFRFTPRHEFVGTLRTLGITMPEQVQDHDLKNLAWGGVGAEDVRAYQAYGFGRLTLDELEGFAVFQVPGRYVSELSARGIRGLSAQDVVDRWRTQDKSER